MRAGIAYHVTPGSFADVADHLIPELRKRGRARESGDVTTLGQRLFGGDSPLLGDGHPAAAFRRETVAAQ